MNKYRIKAVMTSVCYLDIEAEDENDAYRKAKDADGGLFAEEESEGDWEITDVDEIKPTPTRVIVTVADDDEAETICQVLSCASKEDANFNFPFELQVEVVPGENDPT